MEQRILTLGNRVPQGQFHTKLCASSAQVPAAAAVAINSLTAALESLADVGDDLLARVPDIGREKLVEQQKKRARIDDDDDDVSIQAETCSDRMWDRLSAQWDAFSDYRDATVNAWGRKMQVCFRRHHFFSCSPTKECSGLGYSCLKHPCIVIGGVFSLCSCVCVSLDSSQAQGLRRRS